MVNHRTIALVGNPNSGKSTIFNALTGANQHTGNWPGKTVEKHEGHLTLDGQDVALVDLPGAYSLTPFSIEETITRDFIVQQQPDVVVAVVDAANLQRSLYIVLQILETGLPVVLALNMSDVAEHRGIRVDRAALSRRLGGLPVIRTVGRQQIGLDDLKAALALSADPASPAALPLHYRPALETEITALEAQLAALGVSDGLRSPRGLAIKLLEGEDGLVTGPQAAAVAEALAAANARLLAASGEEADTLIADSRYTFIAEVVGQTVRRPQARADTFSDHLDRVFTHRLWGVPIFLLLMWIVFQVTANVSAPLVDWLDGVFSGPLTHWAAALLGALGLGGTWVDSLVVDGIIAGVGGVLVFVPVLLTLYLALALLEESGYMARAAFVMDRFMQRVGLHGKSFLPLVVGFGCSVPAIYATRTLDNPTDRKITAFLTTFMSCGARLPVYVVFGAAFFGAQSGALIFTLYLLGIGVAVITGLLLRRLVFRTQPVPPFVMEMPPYRLPTLGSLWRPVRQRTGSFVRNAGTVILAATVGLWLLTAIPATAQGNFNEVEMQDSLFGTLSGALAPVFAPAGFGTSEASGALITGFVAKEVVVSTLNVVYIGPQGAAEADAPVPTLGEDLAFVAQSFGEALVLTAQETVNIVPRTANVLPGVAIPEADFLGAGEEDDSSALETALRGHFTPLAAVAFNVFILLYIPCMATVAAMRHEFGLRWALLQMAYTLGVAWLAAVLVYQGGLLLGLGG